MRICFAFITAFFAWSSLRRTVEITADFFPFFIIFFPGSVSDIPILTGGDCVVMDGMGWDGLGWVGLWSGMSVRVSAGAGHEPRRAGLVTDIFFFSTILRCELELFSVIR